MQTIAEISQKKVILVAHFMGNVNLMNQLGQAEQLFKDRYFLRYFAIAPPYIGAAKAVYYMLGGNDCFYAVGLGVNFWMFKKIAAEAPALYDLMPRKVWQAFKDSSWMKSILNRLREKRTSQSLILSLLRMIL